MIARLAESVLYGIIVAVVVAILLALVAMGLPDVARFYWTAPVIGFLVGVVVFFKGSRV